MTIRLNKLEPFRIVYTNGLIDLRDRFTRIIFKTICGSHRLVLSQLGDETTTVHI